MRENAQTYDVVVLPTYAQQVAYCKCAAGQRACGLVGQTVTTFDAWVADLWELYGDGRALVSNLQRQMVMTAAFADAGGDARTDAGGDACADEASDVGGAGSATSVGGATGVASVLVISGASVANSPGIVRLAARCARQGAGLAEFEAALRAHQAPRVQQALRVRQEHLLAQRPVPPAPELASNCGQHVAARVCESLSAAERALLARIARYREMLTSLQLVEQGEALALLAQQNALVFPRKTSVLLVESAPLTMQQQRFFDACPNAVVEVRPAPGTAGVTRAPEGVRVRFAFPSGRYAQPRLVLDALLEALQGAEGDAAGSCATAIVTSKWPLALYEELAPALAGRGIACALEDRVAFAQTDFGRALLAVRRTLCDDPWDSASLTDFLLSPFSGLTTAQAYREDAAIRANRLATQEGCLSQLRAASQSFALMEEIATDPEADILVGMFEDMVRAHTRESQAWKSEQLGAMAALREITSLARAVGLGIDACFTMLERATVDVSRTYEAAHRSDVNAVAVASPVGSACPQVVITSQLKAASKEPGSCDMLIVGDLSNASYPLGEREDAGTTLLEVLGIAPVDSALARARRTFGMLLRLPCMELVLERPLNDANAEPSYPAVVLEEFVDCYRSDPSATNDIDNDYLLPQHLQVGMLERGEECLFANATLSQGRQPAEAIIAKPPFGSTSEASQARVVLPRVAEDGSILREPCLSPSQVECYLECPFKWFVQRRLHTEELDEGFDALRKGSFAHGVLETFYRSFQEAGYAKVSGQNMAAARRIMADTLRTCAARQFDPELEDGRLVPRTELEMREMDELKAQLMRYLSFEAAFLPTFVPTHFEHKIALAGPVDYAGCKFIGTIDRVDIDAQGRAVIVDYKGSLSDDYSLKGFSRDCPKKVQTRIYAQILRRCWGVTVVGALYVSYGRRQVVSGAYDPTVLEAAHLPNLMKECRPAFEGAHAFYQLLDATEERVAEAVQSMCAGRIEPRPCSPSACTWCSVAACPKREA